MICCPVTCALMALSVQLAIMLPFFGLAGIAEQYERNYEAKYSKLRGVGDKVFGGDSAKWAEYLTEIEKATSDIADYGLATTVQNGEG